MTNKTKDELMMIILPALIRNLGNKYSAYGLVDYANSIIHNLEGCGYFEEEAPLQEIFSGESQDISSPYIGDPPKF